MIVAYLGSAAFHTLGVASKNEYRRVFEGLRRDYGELGIATLAREHLVRVEFHGGKTRGCGRREVGVGVPVLASTSC